MFLTGRMSSWPEEIFYVFCNVHMAKFTVKIFQNYLGLYTVMCQNMYCFPFPYPLHVHTAEGIIILLANK